MTKQQFMDLLQFRLQQMPAQELADILAFYEESIQDRMEEGLTEEEAVAQMGDFEELVANILTDLPMHTLLTNRIKEANNRTSNKALILVLLILGFPLWFPISLIFVCILLILLLTLWILLGSLYITLLGIAFAGVSGIIQGFFQFGMAGIAQGFACIGAGLACIGLALLLCIPLLWLSKQFIRFHTFIFKKIKQGLIGKKGGTR